jgi:predicted transcriptional regulator
MTVVSTREFNTNQKKYFDMAINEQVFVKRGDYLFHIICSNNNKVNTNKQAILRPDNDFKRAITAEELIKRIQEDKRRNYSSRI